MTFDKFAETHILHPPVELPVRRRKGDSAFLAWFEAQHGTRHQAGEYDSRTDAQLEDAMMQGEAARRIWMQRQQWDARRQSALYAWCARDSTPNDGGKRDDD